MQQVFQMSVYNIVRKCQVLETNLKSEEIANFYPIFFIYFSTFIVISLRTSMFSFHETYVRLVGLFDWGYARTQFLLSVSQNRYGFTLAGYRNEKSATDPALLVRVLHFRTKVHGSILKPSTSKMGGQHVSFYTPTLIKPIRFIYLFFVLRHVKQLILQWVV